MLSTPYHKYYPIVDPVFSIKYLCKPIFLRLILLNDGKYSIIRYIYSRSVLGASKEPRILTIRLDENYENCKVMQIYKDKKQTQTEERRITP